MRAVASAEPGRRRPPSSSPPAVGDLGFGAASREGKERREWVRRGVGARVGPVCASAKGNEGNTQIRSPASGFRGARGVQNGLGLYILEL